MALLILGQHEDPRLNDIQRPDLVKSAIVPDVSLGARTALLGLAFDEKVFSRESIKVGHS
jgi:glucose/arabinose dehydrogenase